MENLSKSTKEKDVTPNDKKQESKLTLEIAEALTEAKIVREGKIKPLVLKDI